MYGTMGLAVCLAVVAASGQRDTGDPGIWQPLAYFIGDWEGTGEGDSGRSTLERHYKFILDEKFIHFQNMAVFPPQEKNPEGEEHKDWGFISYDRSRHRFVLRQFHTEGFVNRYILEISDDGKRMVYTSEAIENFLPGWRARVICEIDDRNRFSESFELAKPGEDFKPCVRNHFRRRQR